MAAEEVGVKVGVEVGGTATLKQLRQDLKAAQGDALAISKQFGETSKEAMAAAKRVAELKDQMSDLNERVALMDPGAKFQVFGNAVNAIAAGFTAAQGAMAAFGVESEDVQKQLLKIQGALALTEGLSALTDSWKDFQRLGAVIKSQVVTAFTTLRGALIATGIGAAVVAVGLLAANFEKVEEWLKKIIPGFDGFAKAFGKVKAAAMGVLNGIIESFKIIGEIIVDVFSGDFSEAVDTAKGAGKRIGAAYNEGFQEEIQNQADEAARASAQALADSYETQLRLLRAHGDKYSKEITRIEREKAKALIAAQKPQTKAINDAIIDYAVLLETQSAAAAKKAEDQRKEAGQKALQELQAQQDRERQILINRGADIYMLKAQQLQAQLELSRKYGLDLAAIENQQKAEAIERQTALTAALKTNVDSHAQALTATISKAGAASLQLTQQQEAAQQRQSAADLAALELKAKTEQGKQMAMQGTADLAQSLSGLAGEQTAVGKTLAIAGTTINTYQAAMQAYLNGQMIGGPYGIVAGVLAAAAAVATGVANVKRIVAVKVPGKSSTGSTPTAAAPAVPMVRQDTGSMINQLNQVNSNLNQPTRVQVVESDITNTQERVQVIENNAKF